MELSLEQKIKLNNSIRNLFGSQENCKKEGHLGERVLSTNSLGKASCYCELCGEMYNRRMTSKEIEDLNKIIKTPYTI